MPNLDDDLRHAENNSVSRQTAIDKLGPTIKRSILLSMEMDEDQFIEWRNYQRSEQEKRQRRQKSLAQLVVEVLKWAIVSTVGAAITYFVTHYNPGVNKP